VHCPATLGPYCGRPEPHSRGSGSHSRGPVRTRGGPGPILEVRTVYLGVRHFPMGGPSSLLTPWSVSLSLDTWRLRTHPCGGVRRCCGPRVVARGWGESCLGPTHSIFTTRLRDSRVGTASLYNSKGYLSFRVPTNLIQMLTLACSVCLSYKISGFVYSPPSRQLSPTPSPRQPSSPPSARGTWGSSPTGTFRSTSSARSPSSSLVR
jgi:hypothetical protein